MTGVREGRHLHRIDTSKSLRSNVKLRRDPTRTSTLRQQYVRDVRKRFEQIKRLIIQTVEENDAFRLTDRPRLGLLQEGAAAASVFDFPRAADQVEAFMQWLREAVDAVVLEVIERDGRRVVERVAWQNVYIRSAYVRGIDQADAKLRALGLQIDAPSAVKWITSNPLASPRNADALGILFTRQFSELQGITEVMSQQIARELTGGLAQGLGPKQIAAQLADRVDAIGKTRAEMLARTEIINAHAEATLNRFEDFGIQGVEGLAEWATASDPCKRCEAMAAAGPYTIAEARGLIPLHPRCRCAWLPVIEGIPEELMNNLRVMFGAIRVPDWPVRKWEFAESARKRD